MLKVSAQILWNFTNHLVNFWVQCTSQTKSSSAVYIYTYVHLMRLNLDSRSLSSKVVEVVWTVNGVWEQHEWFSRLEVQDMKVCIERVQRSHVADSDSDADQTSLPPILQTSFTMSQFAENDAAYRSLTQSLSLHSYLSTISLNFFCLLIDLILIWTMVVSSSRKTSSMHHSGFELGNMKKSITISGFIFWNPYRRVWLIQTRLLMDGLRGVRTRFIPPGTGRPRLQAANLD